MTAVDRSAISRELREVALRGRRYTYREVGAGEPLLLFHGWSGSSENFSAWLPALTPRFRVLIPDLPGCAGAPALDEAHTAAAYASFAHEFAQALDLARGDHRELLRSWRKPLFIVVADADAFVLIAPFRAKLAEVAPNARVAVIPGGHGWTPAYLEHQARALGAFAEEEGSRPPP